MDNNKDYTIPKNLLLNWLYSTDRNISMDKPGQWLEQNTSRKYKLVDTDSQTQSI